MDEAELTIAGTTDETWTWSSLVALPELVDDTSAITGRPSAAVPVGAVLRTERPWVTVRSRDGEYTASIPTATLLDGGWLLIGSRTAPLEAQDGGPFRLVVADGDTLCWNVKDVGSIRFTTGPEPDSVPENPPH